MQKALIVDDHRQARQRMRRLIEKALKIQDITECATQQDADFVIKSQVFDLVVLDLALPDGTGLNLIQPLLAKAPHCYIVISTIHDESKKLIDALSMGAKGYLLKEQSEPELIEAIKGITYGKPPLSPSLTRRILEHLRENRNEGTEIPVQTDTTDREVIINRSESLTSREAEILGFLARGFTRPDIAGILNISKHTVATHVSNVYNKLGISSRGEAAIAARELGLI